MAKAPPFVTRGKAAAQPARMSRKAFEGSSRDVEKFPEGSPADNAMDRRQMAGAAFRKGGKVGGSFPGKQAKMPR